MQGAPEPQGETPGNLECAGMQEVQHNREQVFNASGGALI